jgi:hypothetical protein
MNNLVKNFQKKMNEIQSGSMTTKTRKLLQKNNKTRKTSIIEKMNCNPLVENKTVHKDSCYTPNVLEQIKKAYNQSHEMEQVVATTPLEIWKQLNERLYNCKKEDCWLEEIKDVKLKNNIDKYIFAPDYPKEWETNPNEWLSNFDILDVLKQYEQKYSNFEFIGPSAINFDEKVKEFNGNCVETKLCQFSLENRIQRKKNKIGIIFNLDEHDEDGSHWVSLFIDLQYKFIFYFDSNGEPIPKEISILKDRIIQQGKELKNNKAIHFKYLDNENKEHQQGNTECGMYSLFFIITMLTSRTEFKKRMSLKDKFRLFKRIDIPDKYVEKYRKKYFNSPTS